MASRQTADLAGARCIALAGPTASGKSAAAMAIARRWPSEIISVDSALVYRGMDIGTAKPDQVDLVEVPHHLIDIRDPLQAYSAAEFASDAHRLIQQIHARGRVALLVGGTMLYFKALLQGLDAMPAADAKVRAELDAQARAQGWAVMHAELTRVDPVTAARLNPADAQRIQRALEVYRVSGQPLSAFHRSARAEDEALPLPLPLLSMEPDDRAWLHDRIALRFDAMLAGGLIDEVSSLRSRGDLSPDLPSMRCVGYRQTWDYLDALAALNTPSAMDKTTLLNDLRNKGVFATRQLAKRQLTWLRSMPQRQVIACDAPDALDQLMALAAQHL